MYRFNGLASLIRVENTAIGTVLTQLASQSVPVSDKAAPIVVPAGQPIPVSLDEVIGGRVFVVRGGLQALGLFDGIAATTLRNAASVVSPSARDALAAQGFERLHKIMGPQEAYRLRYALEAQFQDLATQMVTRFTDAVAPAPSRVYICQHMYVRMMMPEDVVASARELLAEEFGHMIVHAPHRDSWFSHCSNTVNLWVAIGRVSPGNGMLVYPQVWGEEPEHNGTEISRSAPLGVPYNFALDPGDILVFSGEQMHSSEVNITDETRYVLTVRFTVGRPRYARGVGWIAYHDKRLLSGPMRPFASLSSRLTMSYLRRVRRNRPRITWAWKGGR